MSLFKILFHSFHKLCVVFLHFEHVIIFSSNKVKVKVAFKNVSLKIEIEKQDTKNVITNFGIA